MDTQQEKAVNFIKQGHNLVITGQGGTGKTHLIKCIAKERNIQVTCYTGMACQQYLTACTLHKFAGLEDGKCGEYIYDDSFCLCALLLLKCCNICCAVYDITKLQ
jgi:Cdc6-like AAA superfamily ATPase